MTEMPGTAPAAGQRAGSTVTVRLFAGASRAMGTRERSLPLGAPKPLSDVIAALGATGEAARVLGLCTWLVDTEPADGDTLVHPGGLVDALPPFAGG